MVGPLVGKFGRYFNIKILIGVFGAPLLLSAPIYLIHFGIDSPLLNSLLLMGALTLFLRLSPSEAFWSGFLVGLLWFYWIALSFRYYNLTPLIPLVLLFIGSVYGFLFWVGYKIASLLPSPWGSLGGKVAFWLLIGQIHPFGFNWFRPEMLLAQSLFGVTELHLALLLVAAGALTLPRWWKALALTALLALQWEEVSPPPLAPLKIKLVTTHLPQDRKWLPSQRPKIIESNLQAIEEAIEGGYDLVVLPESAFPLFLNEDLDLLERLQRLSSNIAIVTGALYHREGRYYNSTYLFDKGRVQIFNKVILVPFGEEIPLPQPLARWINDLFFGGSSDYTPAVAPATYRIGGSSFTNAICYEATHPLIYSTETPYIIALSNNAWFLPSIEPTLQNMLIRYYATIYHKVVYHATNMAQTAIIR